MGSATVCRDVPEPVVSLDGARDRDLLAGLMALVEPDARGDPMSPLRWTCKSLRRLFARACAATKARVNCATLLHVHPSDMASLPIKRDPFHGEWNYTIKPGKIPNSSG